MPFTSYGYELKATFSNSANIATNSPVRIAGVDVGKVISTERDGDATTVTFTVDGNGRPIHDDAFAAIRPRIFLEGNFFIELDPGSPSAPELDSGDTIPVSHTSTAVQLDEVLTALQSPVRADLSRLLESYGTALTHKPTAAEDATQLPEVQGKTGAEALNGAFKYGGDAGRYSAQVTNALLGTQPRDLSRLVAGAGRTFGAFASREADLQGLIVNFNVFTGALAAQSANLSTTIHLLAPTLRTAHSLAGQPQPHAAAAAHLRDRADPGGRRAAGPDQRLRNRGSPRPGRCSPARRAAASPGCCRIDPGPRRRRPGGQGNDAAAAQPAQPLHHQGPGPDRQPDDQRPLQHRRPNYREFLYTSPTSPGWRQNFDGNGPYLRVQPGGGGPCWSSEPNPHGQPEHRAKQQLRPHDRSRRSAPSRSSAARPPLKPERALRHATRSPTSTARSARSARPALGGGEPMSERNPKSAAGRTSAPGSRARPAGTAKTRSRSSSWPSPAIVMMLGIFTQQKASLPVLAAARRRRIRPHHAEFATAQAVTPGQGQAVDIAGIQIGKVTSVDLEDGHAVVGMDIEPEVHGADPPQRDASCCGRKPTSTTWSSRSNPAAARSTIEDGAQLHPRPDRTEHQPRRLPRHPRRRHPPVPAAAGRRRRPGHRRPRQAALGNALRRFQPFVHYIAKLNKAVAAAPRRARPRDPQLRPADHRTRPPRRRDQALRHLLQRRARQLRQPAAGDPGIAASSSPRPCARPTPASPAPTASPTPPARR